MWLNDSVNWQTGHRPPSSETLFLRLRAVPRGGDSFSVLPHDEHLRDLRLKVIHISFPELVRAQVDPFEGETGWDPQHAYPHGGERRVSLQGSPPAAVSGLPEGNGMAAEARYPPGRKASEAIHRGRRGNYSRGELEEWAGRLDEIRREVELFAYFNNDWEAFAPRNAAANFSTVEMSG